MARMERRKAFQEEAPSGTVREPWMLAVGVSCWCLGRAMSVEWWRVSGWMVRQGRWGVKKSLIKWRKVEKTVFEVNIHSWVQM